MTNFSRLIVSSVCILLIGCAASLPVNRQALEEGDVLFDQGKFAAALSKWQSVSVPEDSALLLRQARAYQALGQIRDALPLAETALQHAKGRIRGEALLVIGELELMQGLNHAAQQHFREAEQYASADSRLAVQLAVAEGRLALLDKQPELALARLAEAKKLAAQSGEVLLQQEIAVFYWEISHELRTFASVSQTSRHQQVFTVDETNALHATLTKVAALPASAAKDFLSIKLAYLLQRLPGEESNAALLLHDAAASSEQRDDQRLASFALGYLGTLAEQRQQYEEAAAYTARAAFAAQQASAPESLYLWEWQAARIEQKQNRPEAALAAYRRAVSSLQSVRADIGVGGIFREKVAPLFVAFSDLLLQKAHRDNDRQAAERLLHEVRGLLEQLKAAELQDYFQDRCIANFKAKSIGLEQVSRRTAVLYPVLLPQRTELLLGFDDGLRQFVVPVGEEQFSREIYSFRKMLEKRTTFQYLRPAQRLYAWLIAPILSELRRRQIDTLVIVPDGGLRSIPMAALYDGQHYLVEEFAVAITPGLALTDPHVLPGGNLQVLLTGLTEPVQKFPALPDVAHELQSIHSQYGGTVLKDADFSLQTFGQAMSETSYRIVHIASHGQFDRNPHNTFLLTYDDKLTMDQLERYVSAGKFRDKPVELLTLSACQTAAGDDRAALGLAGVAVKAGARSVLASLWFINDQASSLLVGSFYRQLQNHRSKARALQDAQRKLLEDSRYRHAGYWAPFLIIGNWL